MSPGSSQSQDMSWSPSAWRTLVLGSSVLLCLGALGVIHSSGFYLRISTDESIRIDSGRTLVEVTGLRSLFPWTLVNTPPVTRRAGAFVTPWYNETMCRDVCEIGVQCGGWTEGVVSTMECYDSESRYASICTVGGVNMRQWEWLTPNSHGFSRMNLNPVLKRSYSWIAFVGDSIGRNMLVSTLEHAGVNTENVTFERHSDFEYSMDNDVRFSLKWAPFPENATDVVKQWQRDSESGKRVPDVVILSTSLWHILHIHNESLYRTSMNELSRVLDRSKKNNESPDRKSMVFFHANAPEVYRSKLVDIQKQTYMTPKRIDTYNSILYSVLSHDMRRTSMLLDIFKITLDCGSDCSLDGIHSTQNVYQVVVQMIFNILATCQ